MRDYRAFLPRINPRDLNFIGTWCIFHKKQRHRFVHRGAPRAITPRSHVPSLLSPICSVNNPPRSCGNPFFLFLLSFQFLFTLSPFSCFSLQHFFTRRGIVAVPVLREISLRRDNERS